MNETIKTVVEAEKASLRCLKCAHCGNWVWWHPEHELTEETRKAGRVFCPTRKCETAEGLAREAEARVVR